MSETIVTAQHEASLATYTLTVYTHSLIQLGKAKNNTPIAKLDLAEKANKQFISENNTSVHTCTILLNLELIEFKSDVYFGCKTLIQTICTHFSVSDIRQPGSHKNRHIFRTYFVETIIYIVSHSAKSYKYS